MRKLSRSEFRLLALFCGALFVAANLLAVRLWMVSRTALVRESSALQTAIAEDRSWIAAAADRDAIKTWLARHRPPALEADQAGAALLQAVRESAEAQKLVITAESFLPAETRLEISSVDLQFKLSGGFFGIVRLLFDLQKTGAWRAIPKISLKSDTAPADAVMEMQIRQYFERPASSASSSAP